MENEVLEAVKGLKVNVEGSIQNLKTEFQETIDKKMEGIITEAEYKTRMDAMNAKFDSIEDNINAKLAAANTSPEAKSQENKELFAKSIRALASGNPVPDEAKGLYTDAQVQGGYLVQPNYASQIMEKAVEISPVDQFAEVVTLSQGNSFDYPVENGALGVDSTTERGTRTKTTTPTIVTGKQARFQPPFP